MYLLVSHMLPVRYRRCNQLMTEPRIVEQYSVADLLAGGTSVTSTLQWVALAPHLSAPIPLDEAMLLAIGRLPPERWSVPDAPTAVPVLERLVAVGLAFREDGPQTPMLQNEEAFTTTAWWTPAAVMHQLARWENQDSVEALREAGMETAAGLCARLGSPPPAMLDTGPDAVALPAPADMPFDAWLKRRATCRNFDRMRNVDLASVSRLLWRTLGSHGEQREGEQAVFLKKNVPSAGGLHPTDAYLLVQAVDGLKPGLYRYHAGGHALDPVDTHEQNSAALARRFVAGQEWFSNAHVLLILAPRFARTFWKYRQHPKAYRAVILDVGHVSQLLLSCATEQGLGAFVTAAINEKDIEQVLGLDPMQQSPMAICGIGWRSEQMTTSEFDPGHQVWQPVD